MTKNVGRKSWWKVIIQMKTLEEVRKIYGQNDTTYDTGLTEDHYTYLFWASKVATDEVDPRREKRTRSLYEKFNLKQLKVVKNWLLFQLARDTASRFERSMAMLLVDQAIQEREAESWMNIWALSCIQNHPSGNCYFLYFNNCRDVAPT